MKKTFLPRLLGALGATLALAAHAAGTVGNALPVDFPLIVDTSLGKPTDFSRSASLRGARQLDLTKQGAYDPFLGTGHLGILNSPQAWQATLEHLSARP